MSQSPPGSPKRPLRTSPFEVVVTETLRIGQHYADEFARVARLAETIQDLPASNLDSTSMLAQLRDIAEEARSNLQLELDLLQQMGDAVLPQLEVDAAVEDPMERFVIAPFTTTIH